MTAFVYSCLTKHTSIMFIPAMIVMSQSWLQPHLAGCAAACNSDGHVTETNRQWVDDHSVSSQKLLLCSEREFTHILSAVMFLFTICQDESHISHSQKHGKKKQFLEHSEVLTVINKMTCLPPKNNNAGLPHCEFLFSWRFSAQTFYMLMLTVPCVFLLKLARHAVMATPCSVQEQGWVHAASQKRSLGCEGYSS